MTETHRATALPAEPLEHTDPDPAKADLRRVGAHPDHWYPVALSRRVRPGKVLAATFAGERIALFRGESGTAHALEDRCAHRQVPLSMGVVEGETLRCCYHAWAYRGDGRISQIPYLATGDARPPRGVRGYPVREAYGLVFVFPGDPQKAAVSIQVVLASVNSGAMAAMAKLAVGALRGTGGHAEGTGVVGASRRTRRKHRPRRGKAGARRSRGGGGEHLWRGLATRREGERSNRKHL
jgi:nitrite reductase/ring-hydroxylating ferredoxin subunit